jgi:CO/xanthine dehydrogenase FAD-binding subunit
MAFELAAPRDPSEAVRILAEAPPGSVAVLAGGTDLLLDVESGRIAPQRVLSLRHLPWRELTRRDGRLRIGSLRPLREIERDPWLRRGLPGLFEAVRAVGSVALRQRATFGGNVVRGAPASDLLPILLALDAEVGLYGPAGGRRLPLAKLLDRPRRPALGAAELVEWIEVPEQAPSAFVWQRVRPANDISQVGVAVARVEAEGPWRVALGGAPSVPARLPEAEAALLAALPDDDAVRAASEAAARSAPFGTDRRASESYRRLVVKVLTQRALALARARAGGGGAAP